MKNSKPLRKCTLYGSLSLPFYMVIAMFFYPFLLSNAYGAAFQIPNQSLRALGLAGAGIAYTPGPDSAFYNPANISFLDNTWMMEASLTVLGLPSIEYTDNRTPLFDGSSESEVFYLPLVHLTSPEVNNFRFGFSLTYPYGLAKEWQQPYPAATVQRFSLLVVEANPSLTYKLSEQLSIAAGVRAIYSDGEVRSNVANPPFGALAPLDTLNRDLEGDDFQAGYNLAATYRPVPQWSLAATYRSEVNLDLEGDADLTALAGPFVFAQYNGSSQLELPLPAVFSLASAYTLGGVTFEVVWNRTLWSAVEELDFQYEQSFLGTVFDGFDRSLVKDWEDSDALRFGLTYKLTDTLSTTLGFAIDNTPIRERTLGFELPDSDAYMYCLGLQYKYSESLTMGISYMYHHTTSRSVTNQSVGGGLPGIDGTFTDGGAHAVNIGVIAAF